MSESALQKLEHEVFTAIVTHNKIATKQQVAHLLSETPDVKQAMRRMVGGKMLKSEVAQKVYALWQKKVKEKRAKLAESARAEPAEPTESAEPDPLAQPEPTVEPVEETAASLDAAATPTGGPMTSVAQPEGGVRAHEIIEGDIIPLDVSIVDESRIGKISKLGAAVLLTANRIGASDIHLAGGSPPFCRHDGSLKFFDVPTLSDDEAREILLTFLSEDQQKKFEETRDLDFAFEHEYLGRARANALDSFRGAALIMRMIPAHVPSLEELGLPADLGKFTEWHQGLVLITGPAGCGKSTTAAALVRLVNEARKDHIITIEDPVEFIHQSAGCNVTQRQVPTHTDSFAAALRAALREDPDVIMIGEMRDLETVSLALRAAETGHLVIGTLQTKSAIRTIDRIVDVFPADQQSQVRTMLSESLRGIISQQLIPRADGRGRVPALEVMVATGAVGHLIRDSKTFQLASLMQTGKRQGQIVMDDSLEQLFSDGTITAEEAAKVAENPSRFKNR